MIKNRFLRVIFIILISIILSSCIDGNISSNKTNSKNIEDISYEVREIEVIAMGDMIFHRPIVTNYKTENGYDFSPIFSNISEDLKSADLAIANFEGSINSDRKLSGFPLFNFPKETIKSLENVGFDALSTANNHALDTGTLGIEETIDVIDENNIISFGTNKTDDIKGKIIDVSGIKIGLISFTDTLNGMDSLIYNKEYMVNTFSQDVKNDMKEVKDKSDILIVYPHWGEEYQTKKSERQIYLKDKLFEYGADVILGSHPHVLQNCEQLDINGEKKFVIYSMGNALSNQREEFVNHKGVETGAMVKLNIEKNTKDNKTVIKNVDVIPTFVNRYWERGKLVYNIVKLEDYKDGGKLTETVDENTKNFYMDKLKEANEILNGVENA